MVRAVRGATTVEANTREEIINAVTELLIKIVIENEISREDIISVNFTTTADIDAVYPAVAARQLGWTNIAMSCTNEMAVPGSLGMCIRVMLYFNTDKKNSDLKYVYLKKAESLRPDLKKENTAETPGIKIAIDGPAGAGKSTVAKHLARILNIIYLDTGAMYRTVALKAIKSGIDPKDAAKVELMLRDLDIRVEHSGGEQRIFLDGEDVSREIRKPEVSRGASDVAVIPAVRIAMVKLQREMAEKNNVVLDGRDIGTYVLPNAKYKFFLTASVDERARRRYKELKEKGNTEITFEEVKKDIIYRDKNDSSRDFAPLTKAKDAVEIDSTHMTVEQVVKEILSYINHQ